MRIILAEEVWGMLSGRCIGATRIGDWKTFSFPGRVRRRARIRVGAGCTILGYCCDFHSLLKVFLMLFNVGFHLAIQTVAVDGDASPTVWIGAKWYWASIYIGLEFGAT